MQSAFLCTEWNPLNYNSIVAKMAFNNRIIDVQKTFN